MTIKMEIVALDKRKSIKNLVGDDIDKSIIEFIESELSKDEYNFIITADDIPKAKKVMAELNKSKDFITAFRKDKVNAESVAIDTFKDNVKKYIELIDAKRDQIKKDVEVFERETRDSITKELSLYSTELIETIGIRDNFIDVDIVDLIVLGSVTAKGALTKKARETVNARVMACKAKQDKYDMRLMKLENLSYSNGLETPLTITHIQGIINLDSDSEYEEKLHELISSEMERQNTIKANLAKEANENAQREAHQEVLDGQSRINSIFNGIATATDVSIDDKIEKLYNYDFKQFAQLESFARSKSDSVIHELKSFKAQSESQQPTKVKDKVIPIVHETIPKDTPKVEVGKKIVRINAVFEVEVPGHVDSGAVLNKVRSRLLECDIDSDTLKSLEVV